MIEFVGLRPKLYAPKIQGSEAEKKCKGIKKIIVKKCITFEDYKECLFGGKIVHAKFNTLRSRKHNVTTECITKVALSAKDDKRHIIQDDPEHKTLALGHWRIKNDKRVIQSNEVLPISNLRNDKRVISTVRKPALNLVFNSTQ